MSKTTTLEQAYFHINNGGISFSIVERLDTRKERPFKPYVAPPGFEKEGLPSSTPVDPDAPVRTLYNRTWDFKVSTSHFGSGVSFSFPLVPLMVRWTVQALERVLVRMETPSDKPTDGPEYAFRNLDHCKVGARDGQRLDEYWPFTPKLGSGSEEASRASSDEA